MATVPPSLHSLIPSNWETSFDYATLYTWPVLTPGLSVGHSAMEIIKKSGAVPTKAVVNFFPEKQWLESPGTWERSLPMHKKHSEVFLPGNSDKKPGLDIPKMIEFLASFKDRVNTWIFDGVGNLTFPVVAFGACTLSGLFGSPLAPTGVAGLFATFATPNHISSVDSNKTTSANCATAVWHVIIAGGGNGFSGAREQKNYGIAWSSELEEYALSVQRGIERARRKALNN